MNWFAVILVAYFLTNAVLSLVLVGKPNGPKNGLEAFFRVVIYLVLIFLVLGAASYV